MQIVSNTMTTIYFKSAQSNVIRYFNLPISVYLVNKVFLQISHTTLNKMIDNSIKVLLYKITFR